MIKRRSLTRVILLTIVFCLLFSATAFASDWAIKYVYFERLDKSLVMVDYEVAWEYANKPSPNTNTKLYNAAVSGMRDALLKDRNVYIVTKGGTAIHYSAAVNDQKKYEDVATWSSDYLADPLPVADTELYLNHMGNVVERNPQPLELPGWITVYKTWVQPVNGWVIDVVIDKDDPSFTYDPGVIGEVLIKGQTAIKQSSGAYRILIPGATEPTIEPTDVRVMVDGWWNW